MLMVSPHFGLTAGKHYENLIKNNMKPDEPLVVNPGTWTEKLTKKVGAFVRYYQKKRNSIDFELIYQNKFINRYARIFYKDPAEWDRRRFESGELMDILTGYELEYLSEQNSAVNNSTDSIKPENAHAYFHLSIPLSIHHIRKIKNQCAPVQKLK